jgi:pimeloyl-ACP methyl ester carboxylesterase
MFQRDRLTSRGSYPLLLSASVLLAAGMANAATGPWQTYTATFDPAGSYYTAERGYPNCDSKNGTNSLPKTRIDNPSAPIPVSFYLAVQVGNTVVDCTVGTGSITISPPTSPFNLRIQNDSGSQHSYWMSDTPLKFQATAKVSFAALKGAEYPALIMSPYATLGGLGNLLAYPNSVANSCGVSQTNVPKIDLSLNCNDLIYIGGSFGGIQTDRDGSMALMLYLTVSPRAPGVINYQVWLRYKLVPSSGSETPPGDRKDQPPAGPAAQRPGKPSDVHFVADTGGKLDGACAFRAAGPLAFNIDVNRFVAPTNGVGMLSGWEKLIENRVVFPKAKLRIMAYDVDSGFASSDEVKRESDAVYLNGQFIGTLAGTDGAWGVTEFDVPIEKVRFPEMGANGAPPTPAQNAVRIEVDQANDGQVWCAAVDWASITIRAAAPLMLLHGTNAQSVTWEYKAIDYTSPVDWLNERSIPFEHRLNMGANGAFDTNAAILARFLQKEARQRGVEGLHLIAHSKGASDARYYLNRWYRHGEPFKILSLYSLGAPSEGSILSDLAVATGTHSVNLDPSADPLLSSSLFDAKNANYLGRNFGLAPVDPALEIQRIASMKKFNDNTPKRSEVPYYSIAGDADRNGDGVIGPAEAAGVIDAPNWAPQTEIRSVFGQRTYQALGRIRAILSWHAGIWPFTSTEVSGVVVQKPEPNDLVSTVESVHCVRCGFEPIPWVNPDTGVSRRYFPFNHTQLKSPVVMQVIWDHIQKNFPVAESEGK